MRHVILLDNKITDRSYEKWKAEDTAFWKEHLGVTPQYWVIRQDYSEYPTYIDEDWDARPTPQYLQSLNDMVTSKYGDFGTDFIMVMVHRDNWRSPSIWGTNYSYRFGKQCLEYCRWDSRNSANTFGTAYHERHHSFDAICKQEVGVDVKPLVGVTDWDRCITHGKCEDEWGYIRWKENTKSVTKIAEPLRAAFAKRQERHDESVGKQKTLIGLLQKLVYLLKMQVNQKEVIPK